MNEMHLSKSKYCRAIQCNKMDFAKEHFESISNGSVKYGVVDSYEHLIDLVTGINKI